MVTLQPALDGFRHRLIFIRHGETAWNAEGRLQGQRETSLNGRGRDQAAAVARTLRQWLGPAAAELLPQMPFVASPLARARQTIEIVRTTLGLPDQPYTTDDRLKEISFGSWEGMTWAEVKVKVPAAYKARRADRWAFVPPSGESYAMAAVRVGDWLRGLGQDTLVVAHGGVARTLMVLLGGWLPAQAADAPIPQGRAMVLESGGLAWIGD